jgi:hypothetical protein
MKTRKSNIQFGFAELAFVAPIFRGESLSRLLSVLSASNWGEGKSTLFRLADLVCRRNGKSKSMVSEFYSNSLFTRMS